MLNPDEVYKKLVQGINPFKDQNFPLEELTVFFLKSVQIKEESGPYILKSLEECFETQPLKEEIKSFEDFFKLARFFQRDKNAINRFFDSLLGLYTPASEAKLQQITEEKNLGIDPSMRIQGSFEYSHTQTHYSILMDLFHYLGPKAGETFIDIGSGFGRVGFFIGLCFRDLNYIGYEIIKERVDTALDVKKQNSFDNIDFFTQDLLEENFKIPSSDCYFLYDPLERDQLDVLFKKIEFKKGQLVIAFEGYDDYILEYLEGLPEFIKTKSFEDTYFSQRGAIFTYK